MLSQLEMLSMGKRACIDDDEFRAKSFFMLLPFCYLTLNITEKEAVYHVKKSAQEAELQLCAASCIWFFLENLRIYS